jgi:hypothetical protein
MPVIERPKCRLIPVGDGPKQIRIASRIALAGPHAPIVSGKVANGSRSPQRAGVTIDAISALSRTVELVGHDREAGSKSRQRGGIDE